jgi:starvation-inducible outer membrane lipoprotein
MQRIMLAHIMITATILLSGCVTLAPGADQVRITDKASDVGTCKALGNIQVPMNGQQPVDGFSAQTQFRNQAVGLGSNVALVTQGFVGVPVAGIAYRCP